MPRAYARFTLVETESTRVLLCEPQRCADIRSCVSSPAYTESILPLLSRNVCNLEHIRIERARQSNGYRTQAVREMHGATVSVVLLNSGDAIVIHSFVCPFSAKRPGRQLGSTVSASKPSGVGICRVSQPSVGIARPSPTARRHPAAGLTRRAPRTERGDLVCRRWTHLAKSPTQGDPSPIVRRNRHAPRSARLPLLTEEEVGQHDEDVRSNDRGRSRGPLIDAEFWPIRGHPRHEGSANLDGLREKPKRIRQRILANSRGRGPCLPKSYAGSLTAIGNTHR